MTPGSEIFEDMASFISVLINSSKIYRSLLSSLQYFLKNILIEIPVTLDNFIYSNHVVLLREHDNKVILLILLTDIIYYSIFLLFQCQIKLYTDILRNKKVIKSTSKVLKLIKKMSFFTFF